MTKSTEIDMDEGQSDQMSQPMEIDSVSPTENGEMAPLSADVAKKDDRVEDATMPKHAEQHYAIPKSAPTLTEGMLNGITAVLENIRENHPLRLFTGTKWLDDSNIDDYLKLIKARNLQNPNYPSVYNFQCTFFKMLNTKSCKGSGYISVKDTTKGEEIFEHELIFIPCIIGNHWRLVVVDMGNRSILLYDSLSNNEKQNIRCLKVIAMYLKKEYERVLREKEAIAFPEDNSAGGGDKEREMNRKKAEKRISTGVKEFFDASLWTVKLAHHLDIPRQGNSSDCGVFVLQYAEYLSRRFNFDFTQGHMNYFRMRMLYECSEGRLITA